jgi:2-keto-4-pentenoate hydratase/2-oxohepta-3-ene-1,7-dioic acid hydratase in catechol pathway
MTSDMIFAVAESPSWISGQTTLLPGDLVLTGTPPRVGAFRTPPIFLKPGDVVEVEIDGLGTLRNPVAGASLRSKADFAV